ncbi:hypothetical protein GCM10022295_92260 [Streptomyces osmaniensis]|uniref:Uncharacterized protein n=1 Tax=Streptomyces osmaniensis TaxID=593134 RepID=A0ABP6Z3L3_9ACTN
MPEVSGQRPGPFVAALAGAMNGMITLDRRGAGRPGRIRPGGEVVGAAGPHAGKADLGYPFLPRGWGCGYAAEACEAALDWFTRRVSR